MATQTTGGGSTTSFTNTPQAKDDVYNYLENLLVSDSTIYNATTNTVTLDVMSNDLGGNAKTLFSVEDGDGNALTADYDLLAKDVNAAGVSPWEETLNHNWVRINNGKIEYRIADGSGIPGHGVSVDSLTAGQDFNDQFVYAIRLGNGTLSEATVKIHITGANDAATISVVSAETAAVEAGGDANAIPSDPNAAGQLLVTDADAGENKFQAPPSVTGTYGNFTFDATTGQWTYSLDNGRAATEGLNQADHVTDTLTVKSLDGTATYTITVNITGANDDPVATADVAVATEDGSIVTGSVATNDHDVDSNAILGFAVNGAPPAGFVMAANGGWTFDPSNSAYDHIAQGSHQDVVVSYTVTDEHGASDTATLTITVNGVNDAPTLQAVTSGSIAEIDQSSSTTSGGLSGSLVGADVDDGATLTYGIAGGTVAAGISTLVNTYGTLTVNTSTGAYNFAPNAAAIEGLDVGENPSLNFTLTVSDGIAPAVSQPYTINLTGADDTPALAAVTSGSIAEINQSSSTTSSGLNGTLVGSDVDGETLTYGIQGVTPVGGIATLVDTYGTLTVNTTSGAYNFAPNAAAIEGLDVGENPSVNFTVTVSDGDAPLGTQIYTINLTGADDTPTLAAVTSGSIAEVPNSTSTIDSGLTGTLVGSDVDVETLSYGIFGGSASGVNQVSLAGTYGTLTVNTVSGAYTYAPNSPAIEALNVGQNPSDAFTVTVSDGDAPLGTQSYTVNLTGANDAAVITGAISGSITEDAVPNTVGGNLNSTDVDNANDSWNAVVAATASANGYGTYTMDAAGNWVYALNNANPTVNALNNGGTLADSFSLTTADGTSQVVNITINGHTDVTDVQAPTDILFNLNPASGSFTGNGLGSGDVLGSFTAVDADSTAWTFTLGGTNASLFSLSPGGSQSAVSIGAASNIGAGNYTFTVTATDGAGHSLTETYHVGVGTTGTDLAAAFTVTAGTDVDFGLNGTDTINGGAGDDALVGGQNTDTITGGLGADQLIGGQGGDTFVYTATADSTVANHDTIFDFEEAGTVDVIDLTAIDANLGSVGDQAFAFVAGQTAAVVNNSVTWFQDVAHNTTTIQADNNGDGVADLVITLVGIQSLVSGDFGL